MRLWIPILTLVLSTPKTELLEFIKAIVLFHGIVACYAFFRRNLSLFGRLMWNMPCKISGEDGFSISARETCHVFTFLFCCQDREFGHSSSTTMLQPNAHWFSYTRLQCCSSTSKQWRILDRAFSLRWHFLINIVIFNRWVCFMKILALHK